MRVCLLFAILFFVGHAPLRADPDLPQQNDPMAGQTNSSSPVFTAPAARGGGQASVTPVPESEGHPADDKEYYTRLFNQVLELTRKDYVDADKATYRNLILAALAGMLSSLDPHSQFLDEEDFAAMERDTRGLFTGFGLILGLDKNNAMVVVSVLEDTPAFRAGILPGDHVLRINDISTQKVPFAVGIKALRGKDSEPVHLTLYRPQSFPTKPVEEKGDKTPEASLNIFEVTLTREVLRVSTVKEVRVLPTTGPNQPLIGYIRIEQFAEDTVSDFGRALDKLAGKDISALVLDLRNNPGGMLQTAVEVAGAFVPKDTVIVSTAGRAAASRREFTNHILSPPATYPVAVLVNEYSASGPEIVAGALQDLHRAVIVGQRTFGKGSMQSVISLGDGVGLRLTTANYYTPAHRLINEKGITPDIEVPISTREQRDLVLLHSPSLLTPEQKEDLANFQDTQLDRAVLALRGILLHGERSLQEAPAVPKAMPVALDAELVIPAVPIAPTPSEKVAPAIGMPLLPAGPTPPPEPVPPAPAPEIILPTQSAAPPAAAPKPAPVETPPPEEVAPLKATPATPATPAESSAEPVARALPIASIAPASVEKPPTPDAIDKIQ